MTYEKNLIDRITYHLSSGGLFNPELADHLAVRNLLMECREALAQPEQEPVAWLQIGLAPLHEGDVIARTTKPTKWNLEWWRFEPLYTAPPPVAKPHKRPSRSDIKPLTDEEIATIAKEHIDVGTRSFEEFARRIETAHGIKGEA